MNTQKTLQNIGLSETESRTYIAAVELGEALYSTLATKADLKRATLYYDVIPKLIEKGLLTETTKGKRTYLVAQDLEPFLQTKKTQLEEIEASLPQLRALLATASSKPTLVFYEGVEGVKRIWRDHLVQRQPILELVGIENMHPDLERYVKEHYIWERAKRKIPLQMLISGPTTAGIFDVKNDSHELREVRSIDGKLFPVPLVCDVYGDNVSFTLHRKDSEPIGLVIRSQEIATTMRSMIGFAWEHAV